MGDRRKLHGEIERCLKKVTEGVETFDDVWQKVHLAPNHNQKDRYEQELKKEIKKLQRLRDQIKVWMSSTEIKDKKQLQEARKNIEQKMEKFKIVERETKTKAYSKEGLGAGQKLDPLEKEKEECTQWITESIHELNLQIHKFEADIETLSASTKKKKPDKDKLERLEDTKHSIERHKFHIKSLEKILRAIDNDALDLKPIHNLRPDIEYYIESNQESDFKENDLMYEEINMDNLTTIMLPLIAGPTTQSHPLSLTNGSSNSLNSNATSLIDISSSSLGMHSHLSGTSLSDRTTFYSNSNHGDNESTMSLTTPSSTQPSSPTASPALPSFDDRKQHKSEPEDTQSQRNRANSSTNGSSSTTITTSVSHGSSPKNPIVNQQSSTKAPLSSASVLSVSAPPHFTYPPLTTTQPVLQYSTIVSQNTLPSTPITSSNSLSKQQNIFSPQSKQMSRQTSINNNDSPVITTSSQSILSSSATTTTTTTTATATATPITNSIPNSSHPPSLLTNNDRSGLLNQHILNNISQINAPSSSTVTLANGNIISSSIYSGAGPTLSNSNIPSELLSPSHIDSMMSSQQSSLLSRTIADNDRPTNPPTSLMTNGSSDGHSLIDNNNFVNLSTMNSGLSTIAAAPTSSSSSFLSSANSNDLSSTNNSSVIGHLQDNPFRYLISPSNQQQSIQTTRVPLTTAELRMLNRLNSAYAKLPSLLESERQRTNANRLYGRNPLGHSQMIPYYPQTPPTGCDTPEFYYRLAPDTLFFVFYYMEGSRAQYLAAKALKRQSWRFHTKHMMWFQRHEEPKTITDDYEQGTYIFFDYERWQTRKRDNFIFEYKFLEDREF
ncbi:unnamed protein product [Rotaria socialis]|uniref:CCR4-NOT transcription complex subunit 3 n=5 Tax=Rotaria socialis TaxID=392032 RepID=A0A817MPB7_9BILA|nr:unnamed protein product [Rotaria socialis]